MKKIYISLTLLSLITAGTFLFLYYGNPQWSKTVYITQSSLREEGYKMTCHKCDEVFTMITEDLPPNDIYIFIDASYACDQNEGLRNHWCPNGCHLK